METIFAYPPVPQTGQRALMARFSSGEEHSRRRGYTESLLSKINVELARAKAAEATRKAAAGTINVVPLAREIITAVLDELLDFHHDPEIAANRAGILLQARDATAGLIANALLHNTSLEQTLLDHPPVVNTRRIVAGEEVIVDLRGRPFGGQPRPCPGQELSLALASAILEVLRLGEPQPFDGIYEDWPNLRIPACLEVRFPSSDAALALHPKTRAGFADLHKPGEPLLLPNAWDYASAAILAAQGFPAIATTSLGVAVAAGLPDERGATRDETAALAKRLRRLPCYLSLDIEQGYADDPHAVAEFVAGLDVDGVNLEDGLRDPDLLCRKIKAVKKACPEVFVNARTDTYWLDRPSLDETRRRLELYLEAGADGIFVPGLKDPAGIEQLAQLAPLNVLYGMPLKHLADLGVARVSTGSLLFRMALGTLRRWAQGHPGEAEPPGYQEVAALSARQVEPPGYQEVAALSA